MGLATPALRSEFKGREQYNSALLKSWQASVQSSYRPVTQQKIAIIPPPPPPPSTYDTVTVCLTPCLKMFIFQLKARHV